MRALRPPPSDLLVAGAVVAIVVVDLVVELDAPRIAPLTVVAGVLAGLALAMRRRAPLAVLVVVSVASVIPTMVLGTDPSFYASFLPFMVAGYSVAAHTSRRHSWWTVAATVVVFVCFGLRAQGFVDASQILFNSLALLLVYGGGRAMRSMRQRVDLEAARAELLLREHDLVAREAVVAERERIARELHDVIAHDVSIMVIHAAAAQRLSSDQTSDVVQSLVQIQDSGRKAIDELYLLLGMLRGSERALDPQPGVGALADLVEDVRRSGIDVSFRVEGEARSLGGALGVSVYRVVQESLTNVLKHAGATRVDVVLAYGADDLRVQVSDDGPGGVVSVLVPSGGHGLLGMRERVRMFGGALTAGAASEGGWTVSAVLPTTGQTA